MNNILDYMEDQAPNGTYNFAFQLITINKSITEPYKKYLITLHEYTHYLQSFTTVSGIINLVSYIENFIQILYTINLNNIKPPYFNSKNLTLVDQIEKTKKIIARYKPKISPIEFKKENINTERMLFKKILNVKSPAQTTRLYLPDTDRNQWEPISRLTIRENMAKIAELSLIKFSDKNYELNTKTLYPEYFVIYDFIKNLKLENFSAEELTYLVCEHSLMHPIPEIRIQNLLENLSKINIKLPLKNAFYRYLIDLNIDKEDQIIRQELIKIINRSKEFLEKYKSEVEYFEILINIYHNFLFAIDYRENELTLFNKKMDSKWLSQMASLFGSPILYDEKGEMIQIGNGVSNSKLTSDQLAIFFGNNVIRNIFFQKENIKECPFYNEYPICTLNKKDNICLDSPYDILNDKDLEGCILWNGLNSLGISASA